MFDRENLKIILNDKFNRKSYRKYVTHTHTHKKQT